METSQDITGPVEPVYTFAGWRGAGVHTVGTVRTTYTAPGVPQDGYSRGVGSTSHTVLPDAERRADLVDAVRRALGTVDAVTGLRAVRSLAAMRAHPADTAARAAALDTESDGTAPGTNGAAPDAWNERKHETRTDRTRDGRTVVKRTKVGMAYVQGRTDATVTDVPGCEQDTDAAIQARCAASVLLRGVRRNTVGSLALDVVRITDMIYGHLVPDVVAPLMGTDVTAYEQSATDADATDSVAMAGGTSYLSGHYADPNVDSFAAPETVYRSNTRRTVHTVKHSPRLTLRRGRTRSGENSHGTCRAGILRTVSDRYTAPVLVTPLVWSLVAPSVDTEHRFIGHTHIVRPATKRTNDRPKTDRRKATDIGTIRTVPESADGWEEILDGLNRGESVTIADGKRAAVKITRNKAQYVANDRRDGREHTYRLRNAEKLADALA